MIKVNKYIIQRVISLLIRVKNNFCTKEWANDLKLVSHLDAGNWRLFRDYFEKRIATEIRHCNHLYIAITPNG